MRMVPATRTDFFVGRERELAELTTALDGVLEGRGGLVMLAGDPGIGKTRLTEELTALARDRGATVLLGACYEGGSSPPYWPWTQAIRSLLPEPSEAVMNALEPRAAEISEFVPEIGNLFPDLEPAPVVDPGQARFRLFDSVTSFLNEIAISQPMVLVLDDLHWADRSTLDLLEFVVREVTSRPMLIIGGYRDIELSRRHPLVKSLAALARARGFQRILLRGLGSYEVSRMVEAVGDITLPSELVEEIHVRTEGNPFCVGEITRDLSNEAVERGGEFDALKFRIPEGVREAVDSRLDRMSEECNRVLRITAVIGREFDFALLAVLNRELTDEALFDLVEEAVVAGAVREASGPTERYEFTHALIQQTLAEELTTGRRTRVHVRIVNAMEELYTDRIDDHVAELAHHCAEAETIVGDERLIHYSLRAGEDALSSYAFEEAIGFFERGLAAHGPEHEDRQRADLLFGIGRAQVTTLADADLQAAVDTLNGAFDIYNSLGDTARAVAVAEYPVPYFSHARGSMRLTERALALVPDGSHAAGRLLSRHGLSVWIEKLDNETAISLLDRALEIAHRESDQRLEMWTRVNLATVQFWQDKFEESFENARSAAELAGVFGDLLVLTQARQFQGLSRLRQGDLKAADKLAIASITAAQRLGSQQRFAMAIGARGDRTVPGRVGRSQGAD
jgi:predicted ATPase